MGIAGSAHKLFIKPLRRAPNEAQKSRQKKYVVSIQEKLHPAPQGFSHERRLAREGAAPP
jgi:hypothetical protein